jgi:hypothetical protein
MPHPWLAAGVEREDGLVRMQTERGSTKRARAAAHGRDRIILGRGGEAVVNFSPAWRWAGARNGESGERRR